MLSSGLRIPLLSLLLLLLLSAMELSWSFTDEEKQQIVDKHNLYRSMVSPPAANMLKMRWDSELETFAQNYSTQCTWEHNKQRGDRGENLFAMTGYLDLERAMEDWYIEYQYYNYSTLACKEGEMCGHYTQVVWATSERVGCGATFCETLELINDTDMHLFVCNYQPPGNIRGHKPYIMGASCSMCPEGYSCKGNLCDSTADLEETTAAPTTPELKSTTSLDLQSIITVSATHIPESPQTGTETGSEPPVTEDQDTISTASPDLQSTTIVSVAYTPEGSQIGTEAQSEPIVTEEPDVDLNVSDLYSGTDGIDESLMTTTSATSFVNLIPSLSSISPETGTKTTTGTDGIDESLMTTTSATSFVNLIPSPSSISPETGTKTTTGTDGIDESSMTTTSITSFVNLIPSLSSISPETGTKTITGTDEIDESLMTTTSATSFVNLIPSPSSISPETGTKTTTGTEHPSSADVLITTQTSLVKTEQPVTILTTTTKTPSTPTQLSVPKSRSVPKPTTVSKPPHIDKPKFFPKPPPITIQRPISKKPARHRLMAYSKAIQSSSNSFQSSAGKAASMSVCLPCLGCKQISQPEDIKTALKELTFRYPYAPCFGSLPRWERHSKCSWCGHTRSNALRNIRPYWLHTS